MYVHILIFEYMRVDILYSVYMFENMFIYLLDRSSMMHHAKYRQIRYAHWWHSNMFFWGDESG